MQPFWTDGEMNSIGINEGVQVTQYSLMIAQYSTIFNKGPKGTYIGNFMPDVAKTSYAPSPAYLQPADYLLCTQIYEQVYAVYLITSSPASSAIRSKSVFTVEDPDTLKISQANMPMTRGLGPAISTPAYMTRGGNLVKTTVVTIDPTHQGLVINENVIVIGDSGLDPSPPLINTVPTRSYAINEIGINADGVDSEINTILFSDTINLDIPKMRGSAKITVDAVLGADMNPAA